MNDNNSWRVQLLSHVAFKWNNRLGQIGGNFNNKHSSALRAKTNGGRGHLHMAYLRLAMFDLWRPWVVSMSQGRTLPFWDHSIAHLIFMSTVQTAQTKVCLTGKCAFKFISKSWSDFSCYNQLLWGINSGWKLLWDGHYALQHNVYSITTLQLKQSCSVVKT